VAKAASKPAVAATEVEAQSIQPVKKYSTRNFDFVR